MGFRVTPIPTQYMKFIYDNKRNLLFIRYSKVSRILKIYSTLFFNFAIVQFVPEIFYVNFLKIWTQIFSALST